MKPPEARPPAARPPGQGAGTGTPYGGNVSNAGTLAGGQWEIMRANGKGTGFSYGNGQTVNASGGTLQIFQNATDNGGAVVTKPITPVPGKILKLTKRTLLHPANSNYTGTTAILGENPEKELYAQVGYYKYGSENYFGAGFLKTSARLSPLWDNWFAETITYDPATGRTTLSVNGSQPVSYQGRSASGPIRIGLHSYGWHTGHYQQVADLRTEWVDGEQSTVLRPGTQPSSRRDLNGLWQCSADVATGCSAIFYQEGVELKVTSTYEFQGRRIVWWGTGSAQGSRATVRLHHTRDTAPADWSDVVLDLTLSPDGDTLDGKPKTMSGQALGPIRFTRVK